MLAALVGRLPAYLLFNPVKRGDPIEQADHQRHWAGRVVLEYLAPEMCPTSHLVNTVALVELVKAGIGIGLQQSGEVAQLVLRMDAAAIRREAIPDQYRRRCRGPTAEPRVN